MSDTMRSDSDPIYIVSLYFIANVIHQVFFYSKEMAIERGKGLSGKNQVQVVQVIEMLEGNTKRTKVWEWTVI